MKMKLFLVDDDALYLKSLEIEFLTIGDFEIHLFSTGERCIADLDKNPDLIVLDYHLNGIIETAMNGLETLDRIKKLCPLIPVVVLSSQDRIDVAVNCIHHQAFDYVVKSETAIFRLQKIIAIISKFDVLEKELGWYMARM